jgi:sugar/nucleoside kinase (ribokinase family)
MDKYDVYCYGVLAPSTLYLLQSQFPDRSGYAEIATIYKHIGGEASVQAARYAATHSKPTVTVDCKYDDPIFLTAAVAITSEKYLRATYPQQNIPSIAKVFKAYAKGTVIFAFGHREILYGEREGEFRQFTPYKINPVDTTGAGDAFRAGIIFGMLKQWSIDESDKYASALAAKVCQTIPGVLNSPSYNEVVSFIDAYV